MVERIALNVENQHRGWKRRGETVGWARGWVPHERSGAMMSSGPLEVSHVWTIYDEYALGVIRGYGTVADEISFARLV